MSVMIYDIDKGVARTLLHCCQCCLCGYNLFANDQLAEIPGLFLHLFQIPFQLGLSKMDFRKMLKASLTGVSCWYLYFPKYLKYLSIISYCNILVARVIG